MHTHKHDEDVYIIFPQLTSNRYLVRLFLISCVSSFAKEITRKYNNIRILDVGCGMKPYETFFKESERKVTYIGIDLSSNFSADVLAVGENIPFRTSCFEIALCTQVLEHTLNPERVLREINRTLVNGGVLLISTHGVWIEEHALPDLWRWTLSGLIRLLRLSGYKVDSHHSMSPFISLIQILQLYLPEIAPLKYTIIPFLNVIAIFLSKIFKDRGPKIHVVHVLIASKSTTYENCGLLAR
jgi:SAM-dependent methyltransferase